MWFRGQIFQSGFNLNEKVINALGVIVPIVSQLVVNLVNKGLNLEKVLIRLPEQNLTLLTASGAAGGITAGARVWV